MAVRLSFAPKLCPLYLTASQGCQAPSLRVCLASFRSCHGDSKQSNPQWQVPQIGEDGDQKVMLSKFPSGIPADRRDIILELNKVINGKSATIGARHGIQSRLETLESLGCSLDAIQSQPDVLLLSENEVIRRVMKLQKSHTDISVNNIKTADGTEKKSLTKNVAGLGKNTQMFEISSLLKCSLTELSALEEQNPSLKMKKDAENIISKINLLLLNGFTVYDIKENLFILRRSLKKIAELVNGIRSVRNGKSGALDRGSVSLFIESESSLQKSSPKDEESLHLKHRLLAELFQVDISYIKDLRYSDAGFETILKKVTFLSSLGIDKRDILNHFYLLRHSLKKLEKGVTTANEAGITKLTAITLVNVIQHRYIPPRVGKSRHLPYISTLLDVPISELRNLGQHVTSVFSVDKLTLKANTEYLLKQGFTKNDIRQCLLVIGHDPDVLVHYMESMPERSEFQPYEECLEDKVMFLNAVQYCIERDANFNCKEGNSGGKVTVDEEDEKHHQEDAC